MILENFPKGYQWINGGPLLNSYRGSMVFSGTLKRTPNDYTTSAEWVQPSFCRPLLNERALLNLSNGLAKVQREFPLAFDYSTFTIDGIDLAKSDSSSHRVIPYDVMTGITFGDYHCYMPICVSSDHDVMTALWDDDNNKNFEKKREIVEAHIDNLTSIETGNLPLGFITVSFPAIFAQGQTNRIFTEYPSTVKDNDEFSCIKTIWPVNIGDKVEDYAFYFFPSSYMDREKFEVLINDPACKFFCCEMCSRWNNNFAQYSHEVTSEQLQIGKDSTQMFLSAIGQLVK